MWGKSIKSVGEKHLVTISILAAANRNWGTFQQFPLPPWKKSENFHFATVPQYGMWHFFDTSRISMRLHTAATKLDEMSSFPLGKLCALNWQRKSVGKLRRGVLKGVSGKPPSFSLPSKMMALTTVDWWKKVN